MSHRFAFILAIGMMIAAVGLFSWKYNGGAQANVEQPEPVISEFNPVRKEFKLDDGTPCVMVWAPQRAQAVGVVCNWNYNVLEH